MTPNTIKQMRLSPAWEPALGLGALLGAYLAIRGLNQALAGVFRPGQSPDQLLARVKGFRVFIIGLALLGLSIGLLTGSLWLIVLSLAIGGEEVLESSVIIWAMAQGQRPRRTATPSRSSP